MQHNGVPNLVFSEQEPFSVPPLDVLSEGQGENHTHTRLVRQSIYKTTKQQFRQHCLIRQDAYRSFLSPDFPSIDHINHFVSLYFHHFDPVLPIIHSQKLDLSIFWPLPLALSAVGSQYSQEPERSLYAGPLHEFLRRALAAELASGKWT